MQNWYAVYIKPDQQKKISGLLNKWKLENFYPLNCLKSTVPWSSRKRFRPLFGAYIFVRISEKEIEKIRKINGVVNFLYWLGKPKPISEAEISAVKEFTEFYEDIKVEKVKVDFAGAVKFGDDPIYSRDGNFISIKSKCVKVHLPTLGYNLVAYQRKSKIEELPVWSLEQISLKLSFLKFKIAN